MRIVFAVAVIASVFLTSPAFAKNPQSSPVYREGVHYHVLPEPTAVEPSDKIEVTEVFWYGCGHCFQFEPRVLEWKKDLPEDVDFVQLPAMWNRLMEAHARAFYTAKQLGVLEEVNQDIYDALNIDRKRLESAEEVAALFAESGVDKEQVTKVFGSPAATAFLKEADAKARAYQITGTPQLIVGGRYRVEASQAVPQGEMFKVVDFLIGKIRAEKQSGGKS